MWVTIVSKIWNLRLALISDGVLTCYDLDFHVSKVGYVIKVLEWPGFAG